MSSQSTLYDVFDAATLSRTTDPVTSRAAAENYVASGHAESDRALILAAVREHEGLTAGELSERLGWGRDNARVTRRIGEIPQIGYGEPRVCRVKGTRMQTVWLRQGF